MSDIARYEILNKHGGLYIDYDVKCLHSFDIVAEDAGTLFRSLSNLFEKIEYKDEVFNYLRKTILTDYPDKPRVYGELETILKCLKRLGSMKSHAKRIRKEFKKPTERRRNIMINYFVAIFDQYRNLKNKSKKEIKRRDGKKRSR